MTNPSKDLTLTRLHWALSALAMPAEKQLALLPDFVCKGDELALEFDNWFRATHDPKWGIVSNAQEEHLRKIDALLQRMSGPNNAALWTDEAVRTGREWAHLREMARQALAALAWQVTQPPPSFGNAYVAAHNADPGGTSKKDVTFTTKGSFGPLGVVATVCLFVLLVLLLAARFFILCQPKSIEELEAFKMWWRVRQVAMLVISGVGLGALVVARIRHEIPRTLGWVLAVLYLSWWTLTMCSWFIIG